MSCQTNYINDCLNQASFQYQYAIETFSSYISLLNYLEDNKMITGLCNYFLLNFSIYSRDLPILRDNNRHYMFPTPISANHLHDMKQSLKQRLQLIHEIQFEYHKELLANS